MKRSLPLIVAVLLIAICAIGQGITTQRWTGETTAGMQALVRRFEDIKAKTSFGDWEQTSVRELGKQEREGAGARNYLSGTYKNRVTEQVVSVFLICGFGRDVAVHTPERCFVGSGMNMHDEAALFRVPYEDKHAVDEDPDDDNVPTRIMVFKTARFTFDPTDQDQQTFWAWHAYRTHDEEWAAPSYPRPYYGGGTPLVKIYITVDRKTTNSARGVAHEFAKAFLIEVSDILGAPLEDEEFEGEFEGESEEEDLDG